MVLQICGLCGCSRFAVADFRPREQYPALDRGQIRGMLRSDRDTLEKFARENFHFSEPGDDVYILDE